MIVEVEYYFFLIAVPFPIRDVIGVAPYWSDVDTRNGGEIFYREVTSSEVLNQIAQDIRLVFRGFFNFRPTWLQLSLYDHFSKKQNCFAFKIKFLLMSKRLSFSKRSPLKRQ
jgi:hypothetical protein